MVQCAVSDMKPVREHGGSAPGAGTDADAQGVATFVGEFEADGSGRRGFTVRVIPRDERLVGTLLPGRITWYRGDPGSPGVRYGSDAAWAHEIEERRPAMTTVTAR